MAENILTDAQKQEIRSMIAEAFQEDLEGQLTLDLNSFKKQIDNILNQMDVDKINKKWQLLNYSSRNMVLAFEGYLLIFKFREFLLGEEIDYRYYFFDGSAGISKAVSFKENDLINYIKFGKDAIQINPTALKKADIDEFYSAFVNHYFTLYTVPDVNDYMRLVEGKGWSGRMVRKNIMQKYGKMNPKLRKANSRKYQVFNRGHIYEAIDSAASEILKNEEESTDDLVNKYVFGKYLAYDTIKASQGGDNPITNTSIKSGSADLYDYSTIKDQLLKIRAILDAGLVDPQEARQRIENLFMHNSKYSTDVDFEESSQKALDNLLSVLNIKSS